MSATETMYSEKQRFRSPWLWGILLPTAGIFAYGMVRQLFYQIPFVITMPEISLFLITAILILLVAVFYFLEMETLVKEEGIYLRLGVFRGDYKFVPFSDVVSYKAVTYNPIEKGGRGVCDTADCLSFTVNGKNAIEFTLLSGKKLLVGTADPEDFIRSLNKMRIFH